MHAAYGACSAGKPGKVSLYKCGNFSVSLTCIFVAYPTSTHSLHINTHPRHQHTPSTSTHTLDINTHPRHTTLDTRHTTHNTRHTTVDFRRRHHLSMHLRVSPPLLQRSIQPLDFGDTIAKSDCFQPLDDSETQLQDASTQLCAFATTFHSALDREA